MQKDIVIKSIRWDITDKCNLSCIHCYVLKQQCPDLDFGTVTRIIEKILPRGLKEINFSGREPTLHKDFDDILLWCNRQGLRINITTNGTAISEKKYESLLASSVNMLVFSLDGPSACVHDKIRGLGTFEKTRKNIEHCVAFIKRHDTDQRIGVSCTLQKENTQQIDDIIDRCAALDIDLLAINPVSLCGAAVKTKRKLYVSPGAIMECWERLCQRYSRSTCHFDMYLGTFPMEAKWLNIRFGLDLPVIHSGCSAGRTLYIDPQGRALPCYMLPAMTGVIPNMDSYLKYWDVLNESWPAAIARFRPFIEFTENYSHDHEKGCQECPDLHVCRRCALIALSDHDAICRCQLARAKLEALTLKITPQAVPRIKPYISWQLQGHELLLNVRNGDYFAKRTFELDDLAVIIWTCITGIHSVRDIEGYIYKRGNGVSRSHIKKCLDEFLEYFWKDGILEFDG